MSKSFEYPYPMHAHEINLDIKCEPIIQSVISEDENQLPIEGYDLYKSQAESFKFNFLVKCASVDNSLYELVININSAHSFKRKNLHCESLKADQYQFVYDFNKKDWVGDVKVQALLLLKNDGKPGIGIPFKKGQKYAVSKEIIIRFNEPKESSGSGKNLNPKWKDFKNADEWLKSHKNDMYAIAFGDIDSVSKF